MGFAASHASPYNLAGSSMGPAMTQEASLYGYEDFAQALGQAGGVNGVCTKYTYRVDNPAFQALTDAEVGQMYYEGKEPPERTLLKVVYETTSQSPDHAEDPGSASAWRKTTWTADGEMVYVCLEQGGEITEQFGPQFPLVVERVPALKAQQQEE
jgi:hypothetical protein